MERLLFGAMMVTILLIAACKSENGEEDAGNDEPEEAQVSELNVPDEVPIPPSADNAWQETENPSVPNSDAFHVDFDTVRVELFFNVNDLAKEITAYIQGEASLNGGYYRIKDGFTNTDIDLKLIKVRADEIKSINPTYHYLCADMVDRNGVKYDVDIWMNGVRKGTMDPKAAIVHKVDGKPNIEYTIVSGFWRPSKVE
ncbi:MAG: hypothetical protein IIA45_00225 [Bacteroidetes bacterium]|nr:hypothetical protein [Bacteroidota bacterium]